MLGEILPWKGNWEMTLSMKLVLLGFFTGILVYMASPILLYDETLAGLTMIIWSRISLKKGSVYGVWKQLTYLTFGIGCLLVLYGILMIAFEYAFL